MHLNRKSTIINHKYFYPDRKSNIINHQLNKTSAQLRHQPSSKSYFLFHIFNKLIP